MTIQKNSKPSLEQYSQIWTNSLRTGNYDYACNIEYYAYNNCIKPNESLSAWNEWQDRTINQRTLLTEYQLNAFPSSVNVGNGRVGIVLHNYSGLAHEIQIGRQLRKILSHYPNYKAYIFYAFGQENRLNHASEIYGVSTNDVFFMEAKSYVDAGLRLDKLLAEKNIGTAVYPSVHFFCFWVSLICRHGNQKFAQLKYFPRQIGRISEWAGCDDGGKEVKRLVRGEGFTKLPIDVLGIKKIQFSKKIFKSGTFSFGSISRIEKIQSLKYVSFVLRILKHFPSCRFFITGRPGDESKIPVPLQGHPQVSFIGWVKPEDFISKLDIYLDPWPWGGGEMSFLAMANEIPYLTLVTADGMSVGPLATIRSLVFNSSVSVILERYLPENEEDLFCAFEDLASNEDTRKSAGSAWMRACDEAGKDDIRIWSRFFFD